MAFDDVVINLKVNTLQAIQGLNEFGQAWVENFNALGTIDKLEILKQGLLQFGEALGDVYDAAQEGAELIGGDVKVAYDEFDAALQQLQGSGKKLLAEVLYPIAEGGGTPAALNKINDALDRGEISWLEYVGAASQLVSFKSFFDSEYRDSVIEGLELTEDSADDAGAALERMKLAGLRMAEEVATQFDGALGPAISDVNAVLFLAEERTGNVEAGLRELGLRGTEVELALIAYKEAQGLLNEEQADSAELMIRLETLIGDGLIPNYELLFAALEDGVLSFEEYIAIVLRSDEVTGFLDSTLNSAKNEALEMADALEGIEGTYVANVIINVTGLDLLQSAANLADEMADTHQGIDYSGSSGTNNSAGYGGAKALGGPVTGGVPYLVGEQGPELFVPNSSGTIVPNDQMAGVGTTNIYVNDQQSAALVLAEVGIRRNQRLSSRMGV